MRTFSFFSLESSCVLVRLRYPLPFETCISILRLFAVDFCSIPILLHSIKLPSCLTYIDQAADNHVCDYVRKDWALNTYQWLGRMFSAGVCVQNRAPCIMIGRHPSSEDPGPLPTESSPDDS
jgi:hypothetical protein